MEFFDRQSALQARVRANPNAVRKQALWATRGRRYLRGTGLADHTSVVQVDPALQERVLALMDLVAPTLATAFNNHLNPVAEHAWDKWPEDTGLSKSLLSLEYDTIGDGFTFRGSIVNRAPYANFIRYRHGDPAIAKLLIFDPGKEAAQRIAEEAARELSTDEPIRPGGR